MFRKNGVILVTTLLFVTMIVMFSVLVSQQGRQTLMAGVGYSESEQAYDAAISGIEYVKGQLALSNSWGKSSGGGSVEGLGPGAGSVINDHSLLKIESDSNSVVGYLNDSGNISFSVSFVSDSGLKDNALIKAKKCKYMSYNNLGVSSPALNAPDASSPDANVIADLRRSVPANSFYVVSKGVCGKHVKYVEAILSSDASSNSSDGSTMINGDIIVKSSNDKKNDSLLTLDHVNSNSDGRMMATGDISLSFDNGNGTVGEEKDLSKLITSKHGALITANSVKSGKTVLLGNGDSTEAENIKNSKNVKFVKITQDEKDGFSSEMASISDFSNVSNEYLGTGENEIPQGTYIYYDNEWKYLPTAPSLNSADVAFTQQDLDKAIPVFNADAEIDSEKYVSPGVDYIKLGEGISKDGRTVKVTDKISSKLSSDGGAGLHFVVLEENGTTSVTAEDGTSTEVNAYKVSDTDSVDFQISSSGSVVSTGDLDIQGELIGNGKVFANGKLSFNGSSSLETAPNSGVVAWAGNGINVSPAKNVSDYTFGELADTVVPEAKIESNEQDNSLDPLGVSFNLDAVGRKFTLGDNNADFKRGIMPYDTTADSRFYYEIDLAEGFNSDAYSNESTKVYYNYDYWGNVWGHVFDESKHKIKPDTHGNYFVYSKENDRYALGIYTNLNYKYWVDAKIDAYCKEELYKTINVGDSWYKVNWGKLNAFVGTDEDGHPALLFKDSNGNTYKTYGDYIGSLNEGDITIEKGHYGPMGGWHVEKKYKYDSSKQGFYTKIEQPKTNQEDQKNRARNKDIRNRKVREKVTNINSNIYIKGSLFSKNGDINIETNEKKFDILGAIFTEKGNLSFNNTSRVRLLYDPDYVPLFRDRGVTTFSKFMACFDY